jgi:hypothetical protein
MYSRKRSAPEPRREGCPKLVLSAISSILPMNSHLLGNFIALRNPSYLWCISLNVHRKGDLKHLREIKMCH